MPSLVVELQQEAMNPQVKVSDLLRKALVVAAKLNIVDFRSWIESELKGYKEDKTAIPTYRRLKGEIRASHPDYGSIPYIMKDPKTAEILSSRPTYQPIAELEHLVEKEGREEDFLVVHYPQEILNKLDNGNLELGIVPMLLIQKSSLKGIIDAVRNNVLDWSLRLEKEGILGEGLSFSKEEKQRASSVTYNIQQLTGVAGNVQTEHLQIGDYNTIHSELKRLGVAQKERNDLEDILDGLKTSKKQEEKKSYFERGVQWLKRNGKAIGTLSETIRGWIQTLSQ